MAGAAGVLDVVIPVGVFLPALGWVKGNRCYCRAGLGQAPGEQTAGAPRMATVAVMHGIAFLGEVKCIGGTFAGEHAEGLLAKAVGAGNIAAQVEAVTELVKLSQQSASVIEAFAVAPCRHAAEG